MTTTIATGSCFRGHAARVFPNNTERFDITFDGAHHKRFEARMGRDIPGAQRCGTQHGFGLAIIAHEAKADFANL